MGETCVAGAAGTRMGSLMQADRIRAETRQAVFIGRHCADNDDGNVAFAFTWASEPYPAGVADGVVEAEASQHHDVAAKGRVGDDDIFRRSHGHGRCGCKSRSATATE